MSDIRKLIGNAATSAQRMRDMAKAEFDATIIALLAAIARLEAKAATAKAECEAWRAWEAAYEETISVPPEEQHKAYEQVGVAERAITTARTATDEAWREQAQEPKQ